jgi:hypothetical protein
MRVRPLFVLVVLWGGCFSLCGSASPQGHTCGGGGGGGAWSGAPLDVVELGLPSLRYDERDPYSAFPDGADACVVRGVQGGTMILARLRVSGAAAPSCLSAHVEARDAGGVVLAHNDALLATAVQDDGSLTTSNILLPGDYPAPGATVEIVARAGGRDVSVHAVISTTCEYASLDMAGDAGSGTDSGGHD